MSFGYLAALPVRFSTKRSTGNLLISRLLNFPFAAEIGIKAAAEASAIKNKRLFNLPTAHPVFPAQQHCRVGSPRRSIQEQIEQNVLIETDNHDLTRWS